MYYFDNSASTRPSDEVIKVIESSLKNDYFNPSALYKKGYELERLMNECREIIKKETNGTRVIFTSGGTEANNLAILGTAFVMRNKGDVLYGAGEHSSVKNPCIELKKQGFNPIAIPYTSGGTVDLSALEGLLSENTSIVCVMHINNETGVINDLEAISRLIREKAPQAHFHVDGVQAFMRYKIDMKSLNIHSYSLSGHKIHGPKGIGALVLSQNVKLEPRLYGGAQESGLRAGTENTIGILALKKAIETYPKNHNMLEMKILLYEKLRAGINIEVNGLSPYDKNSAFHILNVSFVPVRAETMLHALEERNILVGNGSACSSKRKKISYVLEAMGVKQEVGEAAIRFSLSPFNTCEEVEYVAKNCIELYGILSKFVRR